MQARNSFKNGSCEMLILHILEKKGDSYAYEISQILKNQSDNILSFPEGSLYPAFYRLIENGYISDYKKQTGKRLVKVYYHIEPSGIERLNALKAEYYNTTNRINDLLACDFEDEGGDDYTNE